MGAIQLKADGGQQFQIGRDSSSYTLEYWVTAASDSDAYVSLATQAPSLYNGLPIQTINATLKLPGQLYDGSVTYGQPQKNKDLGTATMEFDTTGGRINVKASLKTIKQYTQVPFIAPDYKGAINVSKDRVEGVEIVSPALRLTYTDVLDFSVVTNDFVKQIASLTGTTNNAPFMSYDTCELLFLGASGNTQKGSNGQPGVQVKWSFDAVQNATGLTVGTITGINKKGHEYLWADFWEDIDQKAKVAVIVPKAVFVEQVYQSSDFSQLGIPDPDNQG